MAGKKATSEITGYISIAEAAHRLGLSPKRVYTYIEQERLITIKVANVISVSEQSVAEFQAKSATGRPRTNETAWRKSPRKGVFVMKSIQVQLREHQKSKLVELLDQVRESNQHLFTGTMERFIAEDDDNPDTIEIQLVWKQNEMPDDATYEQQLAAFRETFAEVLDWNTARYSTKTVLLHT